MGCWMLPVSVVKPLTTSTLVRLMDIASQAGFGGAGRDGSPEPRGTAKGTVMWVCLKMGYLRGKMNEHLISGFRGDLFSGKSMCLHSIAIYSNPTRKTSCKALSLSAIGSNHSTGLDLLHLGSRIRKICEAACQKVMLRSFEKN